LKRLAASLPGHPSLLKLSALLETASYAEWEALDGEFHELFSGIRTPSLPLWESCYGSKKGRILNGVTLEARAIYRASGVRHDEALRQPPDHIGIECAFFAFLCRSGEPRARFFWDRHLRGFASKFAESLEERARRSAYKLLASALSESARALSCSEWEGVAERGDAGPHSSIVSAAPDEVDAAAREAIVPICGINNCGGRCPLAARVSGGCVLGIRHANIPLAPHGITICARGALYDETFLTSDRLRYPLKRIGARGEGKFARISWDEAIRTIAREHIRIRDRYGPASRFVNYSTGVNAVARGDLFAQDLLAIDGGFLGRYGSYSTACTSAATPYTYGTTVTGNRSRDLLNSKLIILWGHNPLETVFGSSMKYYLREAKRRGTEIIIVDPRRSDSALELADRWIGIRPTTDSAIMDAMAYVIFSEQLQDQAFMDRFCLGFDAAHMPRGIEGGQNYRDYVFGRYDDTPKTPEWASPITGADADAIVWLARKYACAKPAALLQGFGPQRNGNGEQSVRSGTMLACLTGNVGIPGGSAAGAGEVAMPRMPSIGLTPNPYKGAISSFLWTDAVLRGDGMTSGEDGVTGVPRLEQNVKMIFNLAGNALINQHSDINRTMGILRDESLCEFIVGSDLFMTPSARFADILLPGTSMFEGENIGKPWHEGDYILYCGKSVEPLFECRFEYDWLRDLADLLGHGDKFSRSGKNLRERLNECYDEVRKDEPDMPDFEAFRKNGFYRFKDDGRSVAFEDNIKKTGQHPFPTPSGKIEIFSPRLHAMNKPLEIPAIPKYTPSFEGPGDPAKKKYPFQLVGWHSKRRTHSIQDVNRGMDNIEPQRVWINPSDALAKKITDGALVRLFNERGCLTIRAHVTDRIIPGVLGVPQGAWFEPNEEGTDVRGSFNVLSTSRPTPLAKGNPQHSNLIDIEPCPTEEGCQGSAN
jgi:anaerobic dimethyl sulfoxide reductase subunit A